MCAKWNQGNRKFFKEDYLRKKLDAASKVDRPAEGAQSMGHAAIPPPRSRFNSGLPIEVIQEVLGIRGLVIIEYLAQHLFRRFQEATRSQVVVNTS